MQIPIPTDEEIHARILSEESNVLERKPCVPKNHEIRKSLVAFANSLQAGQWAMLVLGIGDKGQILGLENTDSAQKTVRTVATSECYPPIDFCSKLVILQEKPVLAVIVPPSRSLPHFAGPAYIRRGSQCEQASEEMFKELIAKHHDKARRLIEAKGKKVSVELYPDDRSKVPYGHDHVSMREYTIVNCTAQELTICETLRGKDIRLPLSVVDVCDSPYTGTTFHLTVSNVNPERFYL